MTCIAWVPRITGILSVWIMIPNDVCHGRFGFWASRIIKRGFEKLHSDCPLTVFFVLAAANI